MGPGALAVVAGRAAAEPRDSGPRSALLQRSQLDSLPYLDGAPAPGLLAAAEAQIAAEAAAMPRDASAYLDAHAPPLDLAPPGSSNAPSDDAPPPPPAPREALDAATAAAASAAATTGSGELAARFAPAAWRERCTRAENALAAARTDVAAAQRELARVNRRRSAAQRGAASRIAKMKREYFAVAADNAQLAREIARLRARDARR